VLGQYALSGILVVAQTEKDRLAKFPVGRPLLKGNLRYESGREMGYALFAWRINQRRLCPNQGTERFEEQGER
jgi:hypothetical protein